MMMIKETGENIEGSVVSIENFYNLIMESSSSLVEF
jgi:hypothetical protein